MNKKEYQKTMVNTLVVYYLLVMITVIIVCFLSISLVTRQMYNSEIHESNISIEDKIEKIIGIVGTRMIYIAIATLLVGSTILYIIAKKIVTPIKDLSSATKKIASGNFDVKIKESNLLELGELTENFNKMIKGLNELNFLQKDFISNVSHEFRSPLTVIQGYIRLLEDDKISKEEQKEYLRIIKEETERLSILSTNSLKLSKIENQENIITKEDYQLDEQIRKCILSLEHYWQEKNITLNIELEKIKVKQDKQLLEQVWTNLIQNAIKFSNSDSTITISAKIKNKNAIVKVKNYGIVIDESEFDRIFDKFYQADKSHSKEGSGLGLSIVKKIVDLSDGEITINSSKKDGTIFTVSLPIQ